MFWLSKLIMLNLVEQNYVYHCMSVFKNNTSDISAGAID